ncbi:RNA-splicing ligase RtcB [Brachyspira hyodysenteriae]|uniref:RtcB family protein n=1 Tax=Brachyspira hyodysenteriae TaxID=159 RepID=UPI001182072B|nr:RtcB family protein [Brachyspira hyodysenteriae]TVL78329.1 RNA-splicing ligase RtcB [Brachyspira hyodysenteriae]TVL86200.1 RNA-splicing ligase RtcB [Brachyspira hyodysenteriae]
MIELKGKYNKDCKIFTDNIDEESYSVLYKILNEKASEDVRIRIMPDTHLGKGIVVGFTMPLTDRVNPFHIGVDIGCGMLTSKLSDEIKYIPLEKIDKTIKQNIPMGQSTHKKNFNTLFNFKELNELIRNFILNYNKKFNTKFEVFEIDNEYIEKLCQRVEIDLEKFHNSIGTLGGGNHFIEIGKSSNNDYYITIHSGSRNFGNQVCRYHAKIAKNSEDCYLHDKEMFDYLIDMVIAQYYAKINRDTILKIIKDLLNIEIENSFSSVHNFIDFEDFIIRKGAIRSYENEKMIIPFNMRDGILICEGKSNEDWNCSAPHGAGRVLSRAQAKNQLNMSEFIDSMKGIYSSSICKNTLDESPMAYKNPNEIEKLIEPTVNIIDKIKPVLNIKSTSK